MKLTTVLFDLDGTLLPMDQDVFVKSYFGMLAKKLAPHGYEAKTLIDGIWKGTAAMVRNDGSRTNEEAFWDCFSGLLGQRCMADKPLFEEFYSVEFQNARSSCGYDPKAAGAVARLKGMGLTVGLATNPIFPAIATRSRIGWAGLHPEDFAVITTYENSHYCKPNLDYYWEVLRQLNLQPGECLMVGNDVEEDMVAREMGMEVFLLPACLINRQEKDIAQYPHGDLDDLIRYVEDILDRN